MGNIIHPPKATGKRLPRGLGPPVSGFGHFESRVGSETAPAQFREPRRSRRRPEPAWAAAAPVQQVTRAPHPAPPSRRLTISERPSRQAFWKRAWRSSWGRSLKPVYLICKAETARKSGAKSPRRRPPRAAPIRASRVSGQTAARARLPLRGRAGAGIPGAAPPKLFSARACSARRGLPAARLPTLTFAAQLPGRTPRSRTCFSGRARRAASSRPGGRAGRRLQARGTRWPAPR